MATCPWCPQSRASDRHPWTRSARLDLYRHRLVRDSTLDSSHAKTSHAATSASKIWISQKSNWFAFSRCFYPKRLAIAFRLYIFISTCVLWESNPQLFALLTQCSTTEPHRNVLFYTHIIIFIFIPFVVLIFWNVFSFIFCFHLNV